MFIQMLQLCYRSDLALLYNDRSVLENHHLSYSFRLLMNVSQQDLSDILAQHFPSIQWPPTRKRPTFYNDSTLKTLLE